MKFDLNTIVALFESKYPKAFLDYANEYGESGYDKPESGILLANWNRVPKFVQDYLTRNGYALEWSDEWISSDVGKIYRTSPDSYFWKPSFFITQRGEVIGKDEVLDGTCIDEYIEHLTNDPSKCDCFNINWSDHGFVKCNKDEYETGFHSGQTDDPKKVFVQVKEQYPNCNFIFVMDESSQFYVTWSVWRKEFAEE